MARRRANTIQTAFEPAVDDYRCSFGSVALLLVDKYFAQKSTTLIDEEEFVVPADNEQSTYSHQHTHKTGDQTAI